MTSAEEIYAFMTEILTKAEIETLSKRWRILTMLSEGVTQRNIAEKLRVSLCKITRGAAILKNKNTVTNKILNKGENND